MQEFESKSRRKEDFIQGLWRQDDQLSKIMGFEGYTEDFSRPGDDKRLDKHHTLQHTK